MFLTVTTSIIFAEFKGSTLKKLSTEVETLWNSWEIRGMILCSLALQIVLVGLGNRRRQRYAGLAKPRTSFVVWSTYLAADWIATTVLSSLLRSERERYTAPIAFWVPFLLLHLGGPDTITAYSLEDNDLWLRRFLSLLYQIGVASYVYWKFRANDGISLLAIPIFVAGIIKNGERIWCLRMASNKKLKASFLFPDLPNSMDDIREEVARNLKVRTRNLGFAEEFYEMCTIETKSASRAFKIVEDELGFLYDELFTKRKLLNSQVGAILRFVSFLCSTAALLIFSVIIGLGIEQGSIVDLGISFVLLFGAISMDIYSITAHILSNWAMLLMTEHKNRLPSFVHRVINSRLVSRYHKEKLESMPLPQFNLINSALKPKLGAIQDFLNLDIALLRGNYHTTLEGVLNSYLKKVIYSHLLKKQQQYKESNYDYQFLNTLLDNMGDGVLKENGLDVYERFEWSISRAGNLKMASDTILVWHIATHLCYSDDREKFGTEIDGSHPGMGKCLSEYLMYILIMCPSMLPEGQVGIQPRATMAQIREGNRDVELQNRTMSVNSFTALFRGSKLAHNLQLLVSSDQRWSHERKWKLICEVWVEILTYIAAHCSWKEHLQQLQRGGELLTHVSLLMAQISLSPKISIIEVIQDFYDQVMRTSTT